MTTGAWIMLVPTWGVITYYTIKYFFMVLRSPMKEEEA